LIVVLERFDYSTYAALIERLCETHANLLFGDLAGGSSITYPFFLLRHDVDYSPGAALALARVEARLGVRATYFFLLSSELYNIHSADCCEIPGRLVEMGHEVGLHYNVEVYGRRGDFRNAYEGERAALEALSGQAINAIAPHEPSPRGCDPLSAETDVTHAYTIIDLLDMAYISDSCGAWRDDTIALLEQPELPPRMQVLIHPIFWAEQAADRWERLDSFVNSRCRSLEAWGQERRRLWSEQEGVQEHDRRHSRISVGQPRP
jgi:hypothetical protein